MNPINVIINAAWRGSKAVNEAKKDLANIDDSTKKGAKGFEGYASAAAKGAIALAAVTIAAKTAYDALERGAGLELTRQRFDRLSESIGITGDELRDNIGNATAGLLSNAQQMALATDLVALGLAKDSDQVVRLSRVVTELDQDLGELVLALSNQTTRRFDQLGVSVVGFQERLEALEAQGLSTEEAFTEAFLQQAEAQIDRVGGKAGTAAGDLQGLEAAFADVKDAAAEALVDVVRFSGGFEDIEDATQALEELANKIEKIGDNFDKLLIIAQFTRFLADPAGRADEFYNAIIDYQKQLTGEFGAFLEDNEQYQETLNGVVGTLRTIQDLIGIEFIGNMERAVAEAESFDRVLTRINITVSQIGDKLAEIVIPAPRGAGERGDGAGGRAGELTQFTPGTIAERVTLFQDFQEDLSDINEQGEQQRRDITEQYEAQRTSIVEDYSRLRAEEEEDWQRRRARQEEDYRASLDDVRERAAESAQDAIADTNQRLEDLEEDHLQRLQEIIENANLQLTEAESKLDASAVARIKRQRDDAIRRENQSYADQTDQVREQLDRQLKVIQDNLDERLAELEEFHQERLDREEEDRQIRLDRLEEAHQRELKELDDNYREQLYDLKDSIRRQRTELENRYREEYMLLTGHWNARQDQDAFWQAEILRQEEEWWRQRAGLVGDRGDDGDGTGGTGDGGVGPGGEVAPTRDELLDMVRELAAAAGYSANFIDNLIDAMSGWTDRQIALWIERAFDIDVPGYKMGTAYVPQTGLAYLHEGERVLTAAQNRVYSGSQGGNSITFQDGAIRLSGSAMSGGKLAVELRRELTKILREMA